MKYRVILLFWIIFCGFCVWQCPQMFSDSNTFLDGFVNQELLSFMGVVVTITLASTTHLFVEIHRLEAKFGKNSLVKSKTDIKHSSIFLVSSLFLSVVVVVAKPMAPDTEAYQAAFNLFALTLVFSCCLMLFDIVEAGFNLAPLIGNIDSADDQNEE